MRALLAVCVAFLGCATQTARTGAPPADPVGRAEATITRGALGAPIQFLAADALEDRGPGTRGDVLARL